MSTNNSNKNSYDVASGILIYAQRLRKKTTARCWHLPCRECRPPALPRECLQKISAQIRHKRNSPTNWKKNILKLHQHENNKLHNNYYTNTQLIGHPPPVTKRIHPSMERCGPGSPSPMSTVSYSPSPLSVTSASKPRPLRRFAFSCTEIHTWAFCNRFMEEQRPTIWTKSRNFPLFKYLNFFHNRY